MEESKLKEYKDIDMSPEEYAKYKKDVLKDLEREKAK